MNNPEQRLRIVLDGLNDPSATTLLCERHSITEAQFHEGREAVLSAGTIALTTPELA